MDEIYFKSTTEFRDWLEEHHDTAEEVWVGLYKKKSKKVGITYTEALDEGLCYGWIDGLRKSVDDERWKIRFSPRTSKSIWSQVNLKRIKELIDEDRVQPPGMKAYEERDESLTNQYSFERENAELSKEFEAQFRANEKAWQYFQDQRPSYRKQTIWWVISAKRESTRQRRLEELIDSSANGVWIKSMRWGKK
jgi:uncharacterized protein YdeI (YjbR/CyaY-like superfamily)